MRLFLFFFTASTFPGKDSGSSYFCRPISSMSSVFPKLFFIFIPVIQNSTKTRELKEPTSNLPCPLELVGKNERTKQQLVSFFIPLKQQ